MAAIDIILTEDQTEGTKAVISQWLFTEGQVVTKNEPIVELETDKVMMEIIAPASGVLKTITLNVGDEVNASQSIGIIDTDVDVTESIDNDASNQSSPITETIEKPIIEENNTIYPSINNNLTSPAVRRLIAQHDLNIDLIPGTGIKNRVTSRDIHHYLKNNKNVNTTAKSSQHIPITSMRRSIANHMVESLLHTAPHVTSVFNLDLSRVIKHRKHNKQAFLDRGVNLTFTSYFVAASVAAIKKQPLINSQLHDDTIEVFNHINMGIGTNLQDAGLIVPVIKNCENKELFEIANSLMDITNRAREQKLKPADVQGGTFTISNHGVSGSLIATPIIINQPQSAILGIGKMEKRAVVQEIDGHDAIVIKPMCYVTLTIDHRVLDAHQTNEFLSTFVETLENWQ